MPIDPLATASAEVIDALRATYGPALGQASVGERINERLAQWQVAAGIELHASFPFEQHENRLKDWRHRLRHESPDPAHLPDVVADYMSACKATGHPANEAFWTERVKAGGTGRKARKSATANLSVTLESMLSNWQKNIDHARSAWEIEKIGTLRAALLKELEEILKLLQQLQQQLDTLGLDPGILFDLSMGTLSAQNIEHFRRWATYLADDPGVRALCELLGKIRQLELSERIERVTVSRTQTIMIPHIDSREEIVGVRLGRDLEHLVPSELALLADPDTALLFDLKYVEARLMCFDMQGLQAWHMKVEIEEEQTTCETEKQGPMIICVDTSGSMQGTPETIAKAVTLFIASKAREQKRSCYLINFSTTIETVDLNNDLKMDTLLSFLAMSFRGGTDATPALNHAMQILQLDTYKNADVLIISDFVMASLPNPLLASIAQQRDRGNHFHSLVVGDCYMSERLKSLFDREWVFDPSGGQIRELLAFQREIHRKAST